MVSDPYSKERHKLLDICERKAGQFLQFLVAWIVAMVPGAIVAWSMIRSTEEGLGHGLFPLGSSYVNLATPFLMISFSVIITVFVYMFGRRMYWSKMANWAEIVPSPSTGPPKPITAYKMLENCTVERIKKDNSVIFNLFGSPYRWILWPVFMVVLSIVFLIIAHYDIPKAFQGVYG